MIKCLNEFKIYDKIKKECSTPNKGKRKDDL